MRTAYLDCFSGISGDMLLGALIHAGLDEENLKKALARLNCTGYTINSSPAEDTSLHGVQFRVTVEESQPHRNLADIEQIIGTSSLDSTIRDRALAVFRRMAEAEAYIHGCSPGEVHFHEVGAVDAIVDIVGTLIGLQELGIERIFCSPLPVPHGWVRCQHGELPIPAPAVCELLKGIPAYGVDINQELVTPTGAALVAVLARDFGPMPPMRLTATGYGAGSRPRNDGRPNLLRIMIGDEFSPDEAQQVVVMETAIDDWNPETWPHVSAKLMNKGALEVLLTPVHMKKGRPGFVLTVDSGPARSEQLKRAILEETSAIGLRFRHENRLTLPRQIIEIETRWGPVKAKKIEHGTSRTITPEYEECRRIADDHNIPIRDVYAEISRLSEGE